MSSRRQRITPTAEQEFSNEASLGVSKASARQDHSHGTPDIAAVLAAAPAETGTTIAIIHHAAAVKSALVDADEIPGQDSAASFGLIRTTWTSVKAFLRTYFDTLYATAAQGALADSAVQTETDPVFSASEAADFVAGDKSKLDSIEAGAEVNNISDANATDLTDAGATTLHKHDHGGQDGLTDDDHTQYHNDTRGDARYIAKDSVIRLKGYTVSTLPAGTQGDTCFVTDALAPTFLVTVVGGGAIVTPVFYDGTNWVAY